MLYYHCVPHKINFPIELNRDVINNELISHLYTTFKQIHVTPFLVYIFTSNATNWLDIINWYDKRLINSYHWWETYYKSQKVMVIATSIILINKYPIQQM